MLGIYIEGFIVGYVFSCLFWYVSDQYVSTLMLLVGSISYVLLRCISTLKFHTKHCLVLVILATLGFVSSQLHLKSLLVKHELARASLSQKNWYVLHINSFPERTVFGNKYIGCIQANGGCQKVIVYSPPGNDMANGGQYEISGKVSALNSDVTIDKYYINNGYIAKVNLQNQEIGVSREPSYYQTQNTKFREFVLARLRTLGYPTYQIVSGMLIGSKEDLDNSTEHVFAKAGLLHMLVLSGYNITLVIAMSLISLRRLGNTVRVFFAVLVSFMLVYLSGSEIPAVRAYISSLLVLLVAPMLSDISNKVRLVGYSAAFILFVSPETIYNISFALSVLATFSVVVIPEIYKYYMKSDAGIVFTTFFATMYTSPVILFLAGSVNLSSVVANVLISFLVPIVMFLGTLYLAIDLHSLQIVLQIISQVIYKIAILFGGQYSAFVALPISHETMNALIILSLYISFVAVYFVGKSKYDQERQS